MDYSAADRPCEGGTGTAAVDAGHQGQELTVVTTNLERVGRASDFLLFDEIGVNPNMTPPSSAEMHGICEAGCLRRVRPGLCAHRRIGTALSTPATSPHPQPSCPPEWNGLKDQGSSGCRLCTSMAAGHRSGDLRCEQPLVTRRLWPAGEFDRIRG